MNFRDQGRIVVVQSYRGYDREAKRSVTKPIGSIDRYTYKFTESKTHPPTDKDREEVAAYIKKMREESASDLKKSIALNLESNIKIASEALLTGTITVDAAWGDGVSAAIDVLRKAMRKAGYKKQSVKVANKMEDK